MLLFIKPCDLLGINVNQPIQIPVGTEGLLLQKSDYWLIALRKPEEFNGVIVKGPAATLLECTQSIPDPQEDIVLTPADTKPVIFGDEPSEQLIKVTAIAEELLKRGELVLADQLLEIVGKQAHGPHRVVKSPFPIDQWFSSQDPRLPIFYLKRLDSGDMFVVHTPDSTTERRVTWPEMMRSNPKALTLQQIKEMGIPFRPEELPVVPVIPKYGERIV